MASLTFPDELQASHVESRMGVRIAPPRVHRPTDMQAEAILNSDYFRMFVFKVEKCSQVEPHDWTLCHFAHPTEKAKRRDPTKFVYHYNSCTEFRKHGSCRSGDNCAFAHGVFEGWLSPAKYHTEMCTLGRQACTRRVCFFAHTSAELRETVPETLEETAKLRDKLLAEIFINPLYAKTLHQLLAVMSPAQASEVIGEKLAFLQFFLNQFGQTALPALLNLSQSDLQDLMGSMTDQAQREAASQQKADTQALNCIAEDYMSNPVFQQLPPMNGNSPLSEEEAASLLSQISVSNPPSSENTYSGRSSMESYLAPSNQYQFLTPPRSRAANLSAYANSFGSLGESSGTHEARSSLDSLEAVRQAPKRSRLRTGNLFGRPGLDVFDQVPDPRPPGRHSLDNAYQQALRSKGLANPSAMTNPPLQLSQQGRMASLPLSYGGLVEAFSGLPQQEFLPSMLPSHSSANSHFNLPLLSKPQQPYGRI